MTISAGDILIATTTSDGERVALKAKTAIELNDYVIAARTSDGVDVALAFDPMNTDGQFGFVAVTSDGKRVGLVPIEDTPCIEECQALSLTIEVSGFSGTDSRGFDWSKLNGTRVLTTAVPISSCQYLTTIVIDGDNWRFWHSNSIGVPQWLIGIAPISASPGNLVEYLQDPYKSACDPSGVWDFAGWSSGGGGVTVGTVEVTSFE